MIIGSTKLNVWEKISFVSFMIRIINDTSLASKKSECNILLRNMIVTLRKSKAGSMFFRF